jgi:hypothetical protein
LSDPDKVNFYFNGEVVPFDESCKQGVGWMWENQTHTQMRFCEQSCAVLRAGHVSSVGAKFGCPVVIVI